MKPEVAQAMQTNIAERRRRLLALTPAQRELLLARLIEDFFVSQRNTLLKWSVLTGQSAQIDTGYIAQHIASVVLGEPGQGFKGKGVDLADGSEVKSAGILSGVDRPRWNHNLGTPTEDQEREARGLRPKWALYLTAPVIFYVLFDRAEDRDRLRIRAWRVLGLQDVAWRDLVQRFVEQRGPKQYNLQLHPPVGYDDDVVVNTLGCLDFADTKVFDVDFLEPLKPESRLELRWNLRPRDALADGQTKARRYAGRGQRPSRLEDEFGHVLPDQLVVQSLFPELTS